MTDGRIHTRTAREILEAGCFTETENLKAAQELLGCMKRPDTAAAARRKRPQEQGRQQTELQKRKKWHKPFPFRAHNIR